jgi:hypothetical protein
MSQDILEILLSILAAVMSGGIGILTIYLRKKWSAEDLTKVLSIVEEMVKAAEMIGAASGWDSDKKKAQALAWVSERTGMSKDDLSKYIEAAVARMKTAGDELTKRAGNVVAKTPPA